MSDEEWRKKAGQLHTHQLNEFNKQELTTRQLYYVMNGGELGSMKDLPNIEKVTVDLNIVYDPDLITANIAPQTKLDYITERLKPKLEYWTRTFYRIGLLYTTRYSVGKVNHSRTEITAGTLDEMANIFFMNDHLRLEAYSKYETGSSQVFLSELKNDLLYDRAICHELGHLFGIIGLSETPLDYTNYLLPVANVVSDVVSDVKINSALSNLESSSVKYGIDWINDYRTAPRTVYYTPQIAKLGPDATRRATQREPTTYDFLRYGARIIKRQTK